ncbi:Os06g0313720 [Oryza sativa Japonica Group]|uniref:Uncharacterized protein n=2 Tax=Oryza sativa subsp. japonica TaxID=39947 RepID=A0A0P0WVS3_ORYSJ|nr:hypothetical protein [Oryza sativa Japonica Group]BAD62421.1 hypothetical protein [Oryza sativa Japonica Group]BAS97453.1 Os06g0313720 [Oryza sativa Japonica Group]
MDEDSGVGCSRRKIAGRRRGSNLFVGDDRHGNRRRRSVVDGCCVSFSPDRLLPAMATTNQLASTILKIGSIALLDRELDALRANCRDMNSAIIKEVAYET